MGTKFLRVVAAAQGVGALGAIVAVGLATPDRFRAAEGWLLPLLAHGLAFGCFVLMGVAALLLWRLHPAGLVGSALAQLVQVPWLVVPGFSYRMVLGHFGGFRFDRDSWLLSGALQFGEIDTWFGLSDAAGSGSQGATGWIGVNLMALGLAVHLLRTRWRWHRADLAAARGEVLPVAPRRSWPRRLLRWAGRSVAVCLVVVAVPALALWVYNRFDEAPTPASQRWFAPLTPTTADRDNAWLYLLGLGAAEADDPISFGRRRLDAYEARKADRRQFRAGPAEKALEDDPLPFRSTDARGAKLEAVCDAAQRDCLAWARTQAAALTQLESLNAVRLRRYDAVLGMPAHEDLSTPADDSPVPAAGADDGLYRALILRDLQHPARRAAALARLERAVSFWRRVEAAAQGTIEKVVAARMIERHLRVLEAWTDRLDGPGLVALEPVTRALLQGPVPRQWERVFRRGALTFQRRTEELLPRGPLDAMRHCRQKCLQAWLLAQLYLPAATRNLSARLWDAQLALYMADAQQVPALNERLHDERQSMEPLPGDKHELVRRVSYNLSGRTLAVSEVSDYGNELYLQHDLEGLRRLLWLKLAAQRQRLAPEQMPGFLRAQPPALRNPYTGLSFDWDARKSSIQFVPKSKRWKQDRIRVVYPATPPRTQ